MALSSASTGIRRAVRIQVNGAMLDGDLGMPAGAGSLVMFVHGGGSSRHSPRNQLVAATLREAGMATLLFDLLTEVEEKIDLHTRHLRFDIDFLAARVIEVLTWIRGENDLADLSIGCFGASTGAAAALSAAALHPEMVGAVVSRGGRPDLTGKLLPRVKAPTLLIAGANDTSLLELNREAYAKLVCERRLEIVPDAGHLFEEPGALEAVAAFAGAWFLRHLAHARAL